MQVSNALKQLMWTKNPHLYRHVQKRYTNCSLIHVNVWIIFFSCLERAQNLEPPRWILVAPRWQWGMHCACTRDTWYIHGRKSTIPEIRKIISVNVKENVQQYLLSVVESDASQRYEHNTLKSHRSLPSQTLGGREALIAILAAGLACTSNIPESFLEEAIRTLTSNDRSTLQCCSLLALGWQGWKENP